MLQKEQKKVLKEALQNEVRPHIVALKDVIKEGHTLLKKLLEKEQPIGGVNLEPVIEKLTTLTEEVKKKEEYTYEIKIDAKLKKELKGETGKQGLQGKQGATGLQGKQGIAGAQGKQGVQGERGAQGEQGKKGEDGKKITATEVRDKLESLKGNSRLKMSAIKGLEELLKKLEGIANKSVGGMGGGAGEGGGGSGGAVSSVFGRFGDVIAQAGDYVASQIGGLAEYVEDVIGTKIIAGAGINVSYNDTTGETTIENTGGASSSKGGISFGLYRSSGLVVGDKFRTVVPYSATITGWVIATADGSSKTITLDVKRATYTNVPTFTAIDGTEPILLSGAVKNENLALTDWTTALAEGDHVEISVLTVTGTVTGVYGIINVTKTS